MKKIIIAISFALASINLFAQTYIPTDEGSSVHFVIKNFGIKTGGDFTGLKGNIVFNPNNLSASSIKVTVNSNTVDTDNGARDKHLKKEEYFDVDKYPIINFVSTKITKSSLAGRFFVAGNLTIKDVTKPIEFGFSATPSGTGFVFTGDFEINRRDFGVGGSSMALADKLKVTLNILAKK